MSLRAPAPAAASPLRPEDGLLALSFAALPLLGTVVSRGDALTLVGVGILLWTVHRAPVSDALRSSFRACGLLIVLSLLCLLLPQAEARGFRIPVRAVYLFLALALGLAFLRNRASIGEAPFHADLALFTSLILAGAAALGLGFLGNATAAVVLARVIFSLGLVYGIGRLHLRFSGALPLLSRAALYGLVGSGVVVILR